MQCMIEPEKIQGADTVHTSPGVEADAAMLKGCTILAAVVQVSHWEIQNVMLLMLSLL